MKNNFTYLLLGGLLALSYPGIAQYPGALDPMFGQNGARIITIPDSAHTGANLAIQSDGKILVSGDVSNLDFKGNDFEITRLLPNGNVDLSYGNQGRTRVGLSGLYDSPFASAIQPDDKLLVAGNSYNQTQNIAVVARLNIDGSLDADFGQNGIITFDFGDDEDIFYTIKVLPNGKILLGGDTYDQSSPAGMDLLLVQLNPDGSPDTNFGNNGIVKKNFYPLIEKILSLQLQADGKIIAVGFQSINNQSAPRKTQIERFNANGTIDQSFGNNGVKIIDYGLNSDNPAYSVAVQSDQKIVFCGAKGDNNSSLLAVIRLLPDGSYDPDFGIDGQVFTDLGGIAEGKSLQIQPNGKILVGASNLPNPSLGNGYIKLLRYLENGALDDDFGANGIVQSAFYFNYVDCSSLELLPNGKILIGATIDLDIVVWRFQNDLVATHETDLDQFHINISPNPVDDYFLINWELANTTLISVDLFDMQGRMVQHLVEPTNFPSGKNQVHCPIKNSLESGFYLIRFNTADHTGLLQLIKQ
jgi:uncharacterized delta-60 repeat protein